MDNVRNPIIIDQFYCLSKGCTNQTSALSVSDILYENIKGTYNIRSPPMHFACSDSVPCTNLTLSDVELLPAEGDLVLDPYCWNAYGNFRTLTIPPVSCLMEGIPRSNLNNEMDYCWAARFRCKVISILYLHLYNWKRNHECGIMVTLSNYVMNVEWRILIFSSNILYDKFSSSTFVQNCMSCICRMLAGA